MLFKIIFVLSLVQIAVTQNVTNSTVTTVARNEEDEQFCSKVIGIIEGLVANLPKTALDEGENILLESKKGTEFCEKEYQRDGIVWQYKICCSGQLALAIDAVGMINAKNGMDEAQPFCTKVIGIIEGLTANLPKTALDEGENILLESKNGTEFCEKEYQRDGIVWEYKICCSGQLALATDAVGMINAKNALESGATDNGLESGAAENGLEAGAAENVIKSGAARLSLFW